MESVFEMGQPEGFLMVKTVQKKKKEEETEEMNTTEAGSHEGHKTNDCQQVRLCGALQYCSP